MVPPVHPKLESILQLSRRDESRARATEWIGRNQDVEPAVGSVGIGQDPIEVNHLDDRSVDPGELVVSHRAHVVSS